MSVSVLLFDATVTGQAEAITLMSPSSAAVMEE